mgnify:CR=1 FL=1
MSRLTEEIRRQKKISTGHYYYNFGYNDAKEEDAKLIGDYHKQLAKEFEAAESHRLTAKHETGICSVRQHCEVEEFRKRIAELGEEKK